MAWDDEMVPTLRVMLGDLDEVAPLYSDDRLTQLLAVAAKQVTVEMVFTQQFVGNAADSTIVPDPTLADTNDPSFVNLTTIKAVCILDMTDARIAANRAILVKDGSSAIDLSKVSSEKMKLLEKGWCAIYADAKFEYQSLRTSGVAGAAIIGPFRLFAQGSYSGMSAVWTERNRETYFQ